MSYRLPPEEPPTEKRPHFYDATTNSTITVDNGTISRLSIPCTYGIEYDPYIHCHSRFGRMVHDHFGWPSPDHPDHSCQEPIHRHHRHVEVRSIDLVGEGYDQIEVSFTDPPEGLTAVGTIDYDIVIVTFTTMCPDARENDIDVPFCIYAIGETEDNPGEPSISMRDVVTKGTLHIIAGPFEGE